MSSELTSNIDEIIVMKNIFEEPRTDFYEIYLLTFGIISIR